MKVRWFLAVLAALAIAGAAGAAWAAAPLVVVSVDAKSSGVDPAAVRDAIARELGIQVSSAPDPSALGTIEVAIGERTVTVVYTERDREPLSRTLDRPADPADELEVIALLAGNLARDEARDLARALARKETPEAPAGAGSEPAVAEKPRPKPAEKPVERRKVPAAPAPEAPAAPRDEPVLARSFANLSLFHPVSLFVDSETREFNVALGLLYSRLGRLRGVAVDAGVLRTDHGLEGAAVTGLWSWSRGPVDGVVVSGVFSSGSGRLRGAEMSTAFNHRDEAAHGAQIAVGYNHAREVQGAQVALALNHADSERPLAGAQIALVNVGGDVRGAQIGLVNVGGRVRGAQVGLVNVAQRVDGLSLAPLGFLAENRIAALAWSDTFLIANAAVKYSTGRFYSLVAVGADPAPPEDQAVGAGGGIGVHLVRSGEPEVERADQIFVDFDVLYRFVPDDANGIHSTAYRALAGWQLAPALALVAGGGLEHHIEDDTHAGRFYGMAGVELF